MENPEMMLAIAGLCFGGLGGAISSYAVNNYQTKQNKDALALHEKEYKEEKLKLDNLASESHDALIRLCERCPERQRICEERWEQAQRANNEVFRIARANKDDIAEMRFKIVSDLTTTMESIFSRTMMKPRDVE